jgi:hypothetical protein
MYQSRNLVKYAQRLPNEKNAVQCSEVLNEFCKNKFYIIVTNCHASGKTLVPIEGCFENKTFCDKSPLD